jgi:hypothetical protein
VVQEEDECAESPVGQGLIGRHRSDGVDQRRAEGARIEDLADVGERGAGPDVALGADLMAGEASVLGEFGTAGAVFDAGFSREGFRWRDCWRGRTGMLVARLARMTRCRCR